MQNFQSHSVIKNIEKNNHEWILNIMEKCAWIKTDRIPLEAIFEFYKKGK